MNQILFNSFLPFTLLNLTFLTMPPFRFYIPFFSSNSPSRLSSGTSSPSQPPTPPSRPPFRPAGIAQPSKSEPKSKASPSLSRVRSNVAALAASLSASQSPTPTRVANQTNQQSDLPSKKPESLKKVTSMKEKPSIETNQQSDSPSKKLESRKKVTMKEKPSIETENVAGENMNQVSEKPQIVRPEEQTDAVQEQKKKTEAVQEKKKVLLEGSGEKSEADQGQQKRNEIEKLELQERKKVLHKGSGEKSEADDQIQQKRKDKEKVALQETRRGLQALGRENVTQSNTTRPIAAASESTRGLSDPPEKETKVQNRTEFLTDDNHQKNKGAETSNLGNPGVPNGQGLSSMSRKIKEDVRDGISKLTWGKSTGDEKSVSVYTLTGENKGATMGIGSDKDKKAGEVHIRRGYLSNPDHSPKAKAMEPEEGKRPLKDKIPKDYDYEDDEEEEARVTAYINGNTQGINNSIIVQSSVSENDPGVHMSLKFEKTMKEATNPPENVAEKKPETVKVTEKSKNEPRVRRRCLRGLLAESSESEPENPLKPRKHGCRFTCKDKDIENT